MKLLHLHLQIPKAQKDSQVSSVLFALLRSADAKTAHKHVGEIDPILKDQTDVVFQTFFKHGLINLWIIVNLRI